jgi:hypothetical protein
MILTQQEVNALLALEKHYTGTEQFEFPSLGGFLRIPLHSTDKKEEFVLDITRGRISLQKNTFQTRARKSVVLARIDIGGAPHRNPDGEEITCPHFHLYKEGFGDKWATALPDCFNHLSDIWQTLHDFMDYCHIVTKPVINKDLFI